MELWPFLKTSMATFGIWWNIPSPREALLFEVGTDNFNLVGPEISAKLRRHSFDVGLIVPIHDYLYYHCCNHLTK